MNGIILWIRIMDLTPASHHRILKGTKYELSLRSESGFPVGFGYVFFIRGRIQIQLSERGADIGFLCLLYTRFEPEPVNLNPDPQPCCLGPRFRSDFSIGGQSSMS